MPSYLDLGVIGITLVSALLAMLRGFTREILAIVSWGLAAVAAYYLYPLVLPHVKPYIPKDQVAVAVAAAAVFLVALIIVSLITVRISDSILDSKIGALDRSLGFVFGAGRGLLLCAIAFLFFAWIMPEKGYPEWVRDAKMRPLLAVTGAQIKELLPRDLDEALAPGLRKLKGGAPAEEAPAEGDDKAAPGAK